MQLVRLSEYPFEQLGLGQGSLDGPFLRSDGTLAMLISLRGKDGGSMPSPRELRWRRDVPPRMRTEPVRVFLRLGDRGVLYLGDATFARRGKPERDGFRVLFTFEEPLDDATFGSIVAEISAAPPPPAEEAIARLRSESTSAERMDAMRVFLERWFGCTPPPVLPPSELPPPLALLYAIAGEKELCVHHRLVKPAEQVVEDGKRTFYVENQGVCRWAVEEGDDPPVWMQGSTHGAPWLKEHDSLSAFLIQMLVLEATFGAPFGASHGALDGRSLKKVTKRLLPLPVGNWASSRTRFFGSNGVIGFAFANGADFDVWVGAKDRLFFEPLEELFADWENVGF